ncbi:MAG: HesB/IscA family protein, partial [Acidimicrobiales bacterium]
MTDNNPTDTSVLTLTELALAKVLELRTAEAAPESLALWIEISGTSGDAYTYDMYFQATSDAGADAWTAVQDGLTIVVPAASAPNMIGSVLDLNRDLMAGGGGMSIRNPNRPPVPQASPTMTGPPP